MTKHHSLHSWWPTHQNILVMSEPEMNLLPCKKQDANKNNIDNSIS